MDFVRKKVLIPIIALAVLVFCLFNTVDAYALFSINPTVRTGYTIEVNGKETNAKYVATYGGTAYVPLNQLAYTLGMKYSVAGNTAIFAYEDTVMTVDYTTNKVTVNGLSYDLQFGTVRKTIGGQQYIFLNINDIQNIFGIIVKYDADAQKIELNTGFGVLDISYGLNVNAASEQIAKKQLLDYANKIANKTGCVISENNAKAYGSLDSLFQSLNTPISQKEYSSGIEISGVSSSTASKEDIQHFRNLKFLCGLSKLAVQPEYFGCYELSNGKSTMQVVGAFYTIDGLNISNDDLGVAAVATVEDMFGVSLNDKKAQELKSVISANASSARKVQHYIIAVIQNNAIKVVDVF